MFMHFLSADLSASFIILYFYSNPHSSCFFIPARAFLKKRNGVAQFV